MINLSWFLKVCLKTYREWSATFGGQQIYWEENPLEQLAYVKGNLKEGLD